MGAEVTGAFDTANAFEAETVPDAYGRGISLVYEIEDGVCVTLDDGKASEFGFAKRFMGV